ncbi:hypothetical protein [Mumia flava]|uniref:hypothetical protein n=1 Tax=Mumia flava TaxID=1348852 RepID=UPI0012FD7EBD|nr:hypothetical protein [Mumia flava]
MADLVVDSEALAEVRRRLTAVADDLDAPARRLRGLASGGLGTPALERRADLIADGWADAIAEYATFADELATNLQTVEDTVDDTEADLAVATTPVPPLAPGPPAAPGPRPPFAR